MNAERYSVEALSNHIRSSFSSGQSDLDRYFHEQAGQEQRRTISSCFVIVDHQDEIIVGYYTLSATSIASIDLPTEIARRLPRYPSLPAILLGRLAVDTRCQGQGFGRRLLADALQRARATTRQVGAIAVVVDAISDSAARFYEAQGFTPFIGEPHRLFLPISAIPTRNH